MFRNLKAVAATAGVLFAATAGPADAAIMLAKFYGTITQTGALALDVTGEFGPPGGSLTGKTFVAAYRYDTSLGVITSGGTRLQGGANFGATNPITDIAFTIDGVTRRQDPGVAGVVAFYSPPNFENPLFTVDTIQDENLGANINGTASVSDLETKDLLPFDVEKPFTATAISDRGNHYINWVELDGLGNITGEFYAWGSVDRVEVTELGGVPEPGTWALMIAGFGLAGATLRQRRRPPAY